MTYEERRMIKQTLARVEALEKHIEELRRSIEALKKPIEKRHVKRS